VALACVFARAGASEFNLAQIATGVFVHQGRPLPLDAPGHDDIANIGFVTGTRCVAVIDTGGSVRIGRALRQAIGEHTALPICYVINTHVHVDHVLGNFAFRADRPQFVGHALLGAALLRSRELFLRDYAKDLEQPPRPEQIVGPDLQIPIGKAVDLDLGSRHLLLRAWPRAHTDCDLTVYDTASGTLWTGDLLFVGRTPAIDGSIKGWLAIMATLGADPVRHFVPGHGAAGNDLPKALAPEQRYLQALLTQVRDDIARGKPLQDALKDPYPESREWLLWDTTHPHNVSRVYQELEWE
jgi:quinoprotein relay system zinc metallohydrolase 2